MDREKQARRPIRAQLTRLINDCKALMEADPINETSLQVKLNVIETIHADLEECDTRVVEKMLDEGLDNDAQDQEYQTITDYKESFMEIKLKIQTVLHPTASPPNSDLESVSSVGEHKKQNNFKLPRIELRKFDGDLKSWLGWWSQFQKIHDDEDIHASDKIQYLFQSMECGSKPQELVSSYPQTAANYPKVLEALKERFGREDLLLQVYVRELLTLVISNVTANDKLSLANFYTKLETHLRSLAALNLDKGLLATILFPLVESSLSGETLRAWQRSQQVRLDGSTMQPPRSRLDLLMEFIKQEVQSEQQIMLAQTVFGNLSTGSDSKKKKNKKTPSVGEETNETMATIAGLISTSKSSSGCGFCDKKHETDRCVKALSMSLDERQKKIEKRRLCFRCFKGGHHASKCKSVVRCALCKGKHYPVLCPLSDNNSSNEKEDKNTETDKTAGTASNSNQCSSDILMYTLMTQLVSRSGTVINARLVGDPGSQRSYIKAKLIPQLQCEKSGDEWIQNILFGAVVSPVQRSGRYIVAFRTNNGGGVKTLELLERVAICGKLPKIPNGPWIDELHKKGITLTDVGGGCEDIDILLGNDLWGHVLTGKMEKLSHGLVAIETIFGWVLGGPITKAANNIATVVTTLMTTDLDISNLWRLDTIGITDPIETKTTEENEQEALAYFTATVNKDDNKYVVGLPWNDTSLYSRPPTNREAAEKRLIRTTRKLKKESKVQDYHDIFLAWEKEGFIVKMEKEDDTGHYLPHRPIVKQSDTTPVRPVFDASCRVGQSPSLNDTLHKGPNLLELISKLLLRFREKKYGVSADIRKAFQMILVRVEDQHYQKFLWWENSDCNKIAVYKHLRVVFGLTCSPFLLGAVINHHLDQVEGPSVTVAKKLRQSYYVDNMITSVSSVQQYHDFRSTAISIMSGANMKLRKWAHSFLEEFGIGLSTSDECGLNSGEDDDMIEKDVCISLLGLLWNRCEDTLSCDVKDVGTSEKITKRQILSILSQVFDTIGFTCPALALPKLLLQNSWITKIGWDEPMPEEMQKKFRQWKEGMSQLRQIKIPRLLQLLSSTRREVHTFCDASSDFYASVCFMRSENNNNIAVQLLTAKSRLAPIKRASIPRLELMACVVGVRQANLMREALPTKDVQFHFWSDSSVVLAWIRRAGDWGVFVGNRVKEIRASTSCDQWRHVLITLSAE